MRCTALKQFGEPGEITQALENAFSVAERHIAINPDDALALSRAANDLIHLGEIERGVEMAERALSINPHVCTYNVACAMAVAGRTERALDLLEEHARKDAVFADWLEKDGDWALLRDHPRFKAICELVR